MDGKRYDALTKLWGRTRGTVGTSRRGALALLSALAVGGRRTPHQTVAQEVGVERVGCRGRCGQGETPAIDVLTRQK